MAVATPSGTYMGQIGAKTKTYPLGVGQPITVEVTQTDKGVRLKKINPGFAGHQPQPQQQQAVPPVPPTQPPVMSMPQVQTSDPTRESIEKQKCLDIAERFVSKTPDATVTDVISAAERFYLEFMEKSITPTGQGEQGSIPF